MGPKCQRHDASWGLLSALTSCKLTRNSSEQNQARTVLRTSSHQTDSSGSIICDPLPSAPPTSVPSYGDLDISTAAALFSEYPPHLSNRIQPS